MTTNDKTIQELLNKIKQKESEIQNGEKKSFETNLVFRFLSIEQNLNIASIDKLLEVLSVLNSRKKEHEDACKLLGIQPIGNYEFKHQGFTFDQWFNDIKIKFDAANIKDRRSQLDTLKSRLNKIISPELKAQMELEEIKKFLED